MRFVAIIGVLALAGSALAAPGDPKKTYTFGGETFRVVPDEEAANAGCPIVGLKPEDNAAWPLLEAAEKLVRCPSDLDNAFELCYRRDPRADFAAMKPWLEENADVAALIEMAVARPQCRMPLMAQGDRLPSIVATPLPHLANLRAVARLLVAQGYALERDNKPREALERYLLCLRFGRRLGGSSFLVTDLVAIAVMRIGHSALLGAVLEATLDEPALAWLARELGQPGLEALQWKEAFGWEGALCRDGFGVWLAMAGVDAKDDPALLLTRDRLLRIMIPDRTMVGEVVALNARLSALADLPPWEAAAEAARLAQARDDHLPEGISWWNLPAHMLLPALPTAIRQYVAARYSMDSLRVSVALVRFRAAEKRWPASLDQLTPRFLKEVPLDPMTGKAFIYKTTSKGWKLTSEAAGKERGVAPVVFPMERSEK